MNDNISAFSSAVYDEKIKRTIPYYEDLYKQAADVINTYQQKALTWMDVGSGTGKMAEAAFRKSDITRFTFCDSCEDMIRIARSRFPLPNAEFIVSDIRNISFLDEFDVVTAIQVFHYFHKEDRIEAIKKCFRALKPGGIFITFENLKPDSPLMEKLSLERWKRFQMSQGKRKEECEQHIARYNKNYFPVTLQEHKDLMRTCGFGIVEIIWLSYMQAGLLGIK